MYRQYRGDYKLLNFTGNPYRDKFLYRKILEKKYRKQKGKGIDLTNLGTIAIMDGPLAAARVAAYRLAKQKAKEAIQKLPGKIDSLIINQANKKMKSSRGKKIFNHFYGTTKPVTFLTKMAHDEAKRKLHQLNPLRRKTRQRGGTTLYSPDFQREMKTLAQIAKQRRKNQTGGFSLPYISLVRSFLAVGKGNSVEDYIYQGLSIITNYIIVYFQSFKREKVLNLP